MLRIINLLVFGQDKPEEKIRYTALLGYAGVIPFIFFSCCSIIEKEFFNSIDSLNILRNYAVIILTFLGAVHWGLTLNDFDESSTKFFLIWGIIPSLLAYVTTFLDSFVALLGLVIGFSLCYFFDRKVFIAREANRWYVKIRLRLTFLVEICLISVLINEVMF